VLTLNLELPESWLVEPVMALHDLDNLRLADIQEQVQQLGPGSAFSLDLQHTQSSVCLANVLRATSQCICMISCWLA
jgi:hypothetical protein